MINVCLHLQQMLWNTFVSICAVVFDAKSLAHKIKKQQQHSAQMNSHLELG